jgi:hypothetical protein
LLSTLSLLHLLSPPLLSVFSPNTSTEGRDNNCFQRSSYRLHRVSPISLVSLAVALSPQVLPHSRALPFNDLTFSIFLAIALHDPIRAYVLELCRLRGQPSRGIWTDTL